MYRTGFALVCVLILGGCATIPQSAPVQKQESIVCTLSLGKNATFYDGFCSPETEKIFQIGFGIGRKLRLLDVEIEKQSHELDCLNEEYDLKFSRTLSPFVIATGASDAEKKFAEKGCTSQLMRTSSGLRSDIESAKNEITRLQLKKNRVETVATEVEREPSRADLILKGYESTGPLDEIDIDFRWRPFVEKKGGVSGLSIDQKSLLRKEYYGINPELDRKIMSGAYINGFGVGHARQGRFASTGWKYAVLDSLVAGVLVYGLATKNVGYWGPALVFGIPLSRIAQYYDVYQYNLDQGIDVQKLRTENRVKIPTFSYAWSW